MLTVLKEAPSIKKSSGWVSIFECACDCGNTVTKRRDVLLQKTATKSCGCLRSEIAKTLRDIPLLRPGDRFGFLTVISGPSKCKYNFMCECGKTVIARRADVTSGKQKSCGCWRKYSKKLGAKPDDLTGQRFGLLVCQKMTKVTPKQPTHSKIHWECLCDCGKTATVSARRLKASAKTKKSFLNCGSRDNHPEGIGAWYPPMPKPIPEGVSDLYLEFSGLTRTRLRKSNSKIEDAKRDRLLRACWIVYYREVFLGESLSPEWKKNYLKKSTTYSSIDVFWESKLEEFGGQITDANGRTRKLKCDRTKEIGGEVTNVTFPTYPVLSDLGNTMLPKTKIKFKRC